MLFLQYILRYIIHYVFMLYFCYISWHKKYAIKMLYITLYFAVVSTVLSSDVLGMGSYSLTIFNAYAVECSLSSLNPSLL